MNLLIIILNLMQVISNIDYLVLIQVILIFLTGGIVKGLIGVGLPTVTLTLLSFLFDIKESISIILLPIILTNLYQMFNGKYLKQIVNDVKIFQFVAFLFIFPGFYFLTILKSDTILFFLGIILILNSLLGLMKYEIKFKNYTSKYFHIFIGSMTGVVTGVTGIYTMPFIFLIQSLQYSKDKVIQLMGLTFFIFGCTQFFLFSLHDMINVDKLIFSLVACFPILFGVYLGTILRKKISEDSFKKLFNFILVVMGIILILKITF
tara:strand:+ start:30882 stop:31670 length:789 start_codon:yes stop_codon:yes gene_type:complete